MTSPTGMTLCCLLFVCHLFWHVCDGLTYKRQSEEERLLEYLFRDYNPSARPVLNSSKTVTVNLQFSLIQIQELNVRSQILTTTGFLILDWNDERLTWDKEISSLDEVVIDSRSIWKPEFAVINGAEGIYEEYNEFQGILHPDGLVRWEPGGVFKTMCHIDITYYPFDEQKCQLIFGAWSYHTTKMNLTTTSTVVNNNTYKHNGEWHMAKTSALRDEFNFENSPDQKFSNIVFRLYLQRRHTFYIMNVILPGILTSALLLSIFFCTPSQKVHIGVAALLSFRLFLLNVADTIPRTSDHVPLLGIYLTSTMAITTLAMIATVLVLNLYAMKEKPVPTWAKKMFLDYLGKLLCVCNCSIIQERLRQRNDAESRRRNRNKPAFTMIPSSSPKHENNGRSQSLTNNPAVHLPRGCEVSKERAQSLGWVAPQTDKNKTGRKSQDLHNYGREWVHVAAVCDRLFFWLCLVFIVVTTMVLFHPLTTSKYFNLTQHKKTR